VLGLKGQRLGEGGKNKTINWWWGTTIGRHGTMQFLKTPRKGNCTDGKVKLGGETMNGEVKFPRNFLEKKKKGTLHGWQVGA